MYFRPLLRPYLLAQPTPLPDWLGLELLRPGRRRIRCGVRLAGSGLFGFVAMSLGDSIPTY